MRRKISRLISRPQLLFATACLAALTFNNWLLGPLLNRKLFARQGSVSEFSAITQPHYWVFRGLDITSGILFILLALLLYRQITRLGKAHNWLIWGTLVLGAANIVDASFVLPCSETLDKACRLAVHISLRHFDIPSHGWSSVVIAVCYFVLPLAGYIYALSHKNRRLIILSALAVGVAIEAFLSAILQYAANSSFSIKSDGIGQEVQMLLIGLWFAYLAYSIYQFNAPGLDRTLAASTAAGARTKTRVKQNLAGRSRS